MYFHQDAINIDGLAAVFAVSNALQRIDSRLINHGERVAFIACELCDAGNLKLDTRLLFILSVFHDIGAYKTDEIDRMVEFETLNVQNHAIYGYLFLKYMSPLSEAAEVILHHHASWRELEKSDSPYRDYSALIHLADRIDILFLHRHDTDLYDTLAKDSSHIFKPEYTELVTRCFGKLRIFERLTDGSFHQSNLDRIRHLNITRENALEYLKMLAFSIDFRSEYTVTHTVNTVSIALNIAQHFGIDGGQLGNIYLGALLHDIGKIAIPIEILEDPGRLSQAQMEVMRTHVTETENIIRGIVSEDVLLIAARHHEKLDGSGYPHALTGDCLSFAQRIVAVADIVSALVSRRSYKEPFPKDKTIAILRSMREVQLDASVCDYVCENYDRIMHDTDVSRNIVVSRYQALLSEYERLKKSVSA